ncbi:hypothetical protein [Aquabacter sediminis]|uniref:hypothetical protein n=1 Tax=Aquabacter sediminis TaxID=3029197 RepID=UPI00237E7360|nr:hypothetical protein [Aquabacter sp. P-9]MDE1568104.1 hypothetical protein [Aquabacter sp. P-9]
MAFLQATATWSDHAFDGASSLFAAQTYDKVTTQLFLEYGAADWLTLMVAPEVVRISVGAPTDQSYFGPGYTDVGLRMRLAEGHTLGSDFVVSAQVVARFPGAKPSEGEAVIGYVNGELDLRLLAGISFDLWGYSSFVDLEVAQRQRYGAPPNEFRFDATLGVRVAPKWLALFQSFNVISEGAGDGPVFDLSYEYYKLQIGGMYELNPSVSLMAAVVSTYYARNAPQENGIVLGALVRY